MCQFLRFDQEDQKPYCEASNPGDADICLDCIITTSSNPPELIQRVKFKRLMELYPYAGFFRGARGEQPL